MYLLTIFFLILIHTYFTVSKSMFIRRQMDTTKQINSNENEITTQMNPTAQANFGTENPRLQMSPTTEERSTTERNINLTDSLDPIGSVRRLHPSDQLNEDKQPSSNTMDKKALRDFGALDDPIQRTTSEDTLQWLLSKKLGFMDPAPYNIGQKSKGLMNPVTEGLWKFEGYDDLKSINDRVRDEMSDCEGQKMKCIDNTDYDQPVCVTDRSMPLFLNSHVRMKGFPSFCVVEYRNCLKIYEKTGKYYADDYNEVYLEFLHYGWCNECGTVTDCDI